MEMCCCSYFQWCGYFWGPWVSFFTTDAFSVGVTRITSRADVSWTHSLPFCFWPIFKFWIVAILSKGCKPDNFESQNSPKLSIANICGFCLNFIECESFREWNSPDILALYETNLDDSIDSGKYLPLILSDSITHIHDLAVYVKEELPLAQDVSLENCGFLYFLLALLHSLSYLFFLCKSPFHL